jgi:hypothetical protein
LFYLKLVRLSPPGHISTPVPDPIFSYGDVHKRIHLQEILLTSHAQPQTSAALDDRDGP